MIMEKYITKNGIKYELRGEQYYPLLEISEQTNYKIGKYGHLHLDFIIRKENIHLFHKSINSDSIITLSPLHFITILCISE